MVSWYHVYVLCKKVETVLFLSFLVGQIELSKQVEKAWVDLLPSLKDIDVGVAASAQLSSLHPPKYVTASGGNEAAIGRGGGLSVTHGDLDDQECKEDEEEVLSVWQSRCQYDSGRCPIDSVSCARSCANWFPGSIYMYKKSQFC